MKPGRTLLVLGWVSVAAAMAAETGASQRASAAERLGVHYLAPAAPAPALSPTPTPPDQAEGGPALMLPRFEVRDARIPLTVDEVFTSKGRLAEAKQRHLSPLYQATFGPIAAVAALYFNPLMVLRGVRANDAEAMVLYQQEEDLRRRGETKSLEELGRLADAAARSEHSSAKPQPVQLKQNKRSQ